MSFTSRPAFAVALLSLLAAPAFAAPPAAAITARLGTPGFGLEGSICLANRISFRVNGSLFSLGATQDESDISYDADLKLRSLAGLVDFHPTAGSFHFTGGLVYNKNRVEATAVPTAGTFDLGDTTYSAAEVGTLRGEGRIGSRTVAPYLGLGFGSAAGDSRVFFAIDLGVVFQGSPRVELSATGPLASDPQFRANLQAEQDDANRELNKALLRYYPVFSMGLGVRF